MTDMMNIETEFLSILLNHVELIKMTVVRKEYFENKQLGRIFEIIKECDVFDPTVFIEKGFDDMELLLMIHQNFMFESAYLNVFKKDEIRILNHYKTVCLEALNLKLAKREIDYESYKKEFNRIDEIKPLNLKKHPTKDELVKIVTSKDKLISLGKFNQLAKILRLEEDDTVTVAGPPGFGKTAFLMNLFNECLNDDRYYCQYYNLEVNKKLFTKRLLAIESNEKVADIPKFIENKNQNIERAIQRLADKDYYLYNNPIHYEKLEAEIISNLKKDKQNIVFVDYLGIIGLDDRNYNENDYKRLTHIMKELRILCQAYHVLVFIACQCDRNSLKNEKLTLFSLKGSGEIENSSTHVVLIYENKEIESKFDFIRNITVDIAKNRNNYTYRYNAYFITNKQLINETESKKDVRV